MRILCVFFCLFTSQLTFYSSVFAKGYRTSSKDFIHLKENNRSERVELISASKDLITISFPKRFDIDLLA